MRRSSMSVSLVVGLAFCFTCVVVSAVPLAHAYLPVVVMHGILSSPTAMTPIKDFINQAHPGQQVCLIDMYDDLKSFVPIWTQAAELKRQVLDVCKINGPFHIVAHSQGGVVARAMIQNWDGHEVQTLVTLSSPLLGQFGDTKYLQPFFPNRLPSEVSKLLYTSWFQNSLSIANYWKDVEKYDLYMKENVLLPLLNNEKTTSNSARYKQNFLRVKNYVAFGGPNDGVIQPYQSALWTYFADGNGKTVVPMSQLKVYSDDSFGLKTIQTSGRLHVFDIPGIEHTHWYSVPSVFDQYKNFLN